MLASECLQRTATWWHPQPVVQSPVKVLQRERICCCAGILGECGQGVPPPVGVVGAEGQQPWGCVDPAWLGTTELGTAWVWVPTTRNPPLALPYTCDQQVRLQGQPHPWRPISVSLVMVSSPVLLLGTNYRRQGSLPSLPGGLGRDSARLFQWDFEGVR